MVILALLWVTWCILHSLLISQVAHATAKRLFPKYYPMYRLFYVCFSLVSLLPVLWYHFSIQQQLLVQENIALRTVQLVLLLYAGGMFWAGARVYDMQYFLGLSQWKNRTGQDRINVLPFHTEGVLNYVRHPWYSGGIAFLWGAGAITDVYLLTRAILTMYIITGTLLEESRLKKELGSSYIEYCKEVPMLIPWKLKPTNR